MAGVVAVFMGWRSMRRNDIIFALVFSLLPCFVIADGNIDELIVASLQRSGIQPADVCSDDVFLRRVYLDVTGTLPTADEARKFILNNQPDKRRLLVDRLLGSDEFADYRTLKWCDILRVKSEFPINMWPNGVQAYARWIHDSMQHNMPYDRFVRELLMSSGSNFRVPPVNFYRGVQGETSTNIASAVALTFMGSRIDKWPERQKQNMEVFFSRIKHKSTSEWKEVIVMMDPAAEGSLKAVLPDGQKVTIPSNIDPRSVFADWLISPSNPWFTRNIVNRVWSWLLGYGLINEVDDIRPDNPPVHPDVLSYLEKELVSSRYDLRHIYRIILNSATYQQSSKLLDENNPGGHELLFASYPVRRLDAEVLLDALCLISGNNDEYVSPIPEPFTFIPQRNRTIELTDGSITSQFLKMFGRPDRNTGLESERKNDLTTDQCLHMLNSSHVMDKITKGWRLRNLSKNMKQGGDEAMLNGIYLTILSRFPSAEEVSLGKLYISKYGRQNGVTDVIWALINSKEFLYRH